MAKLAQEAVGHSERFGEAELVDEASLAASAEAVVDFDYIGEFGGVVTETDFTAHAVAPLSASVSYASTQAFSKGGSSQYRLPDRVSADTGPYGGSQPLPDASAPASQAGDGPSSYRIDPTDPTWRNPANASYAERMGAGGFDYYAASAGGYSRTSDVSGVVEETVFVGGSEAHYDFAGNHAVGNTRVDYAADFTRSDKASNRAGGVSQESDVKTPGSRAAEAMSPQKVAGDVAAAVSGGIASSSLDAYSSDPDEQLADQAQGRAGSAATARVVRAVESRNAALRGAESASATSEVASQGASAEARTVLHRQIVNPKQRATRLAKLGESVERARAAAVAVKSKAAAAANALASKSGALVAAIAIAVCLPLLAVLAIPACTVLFVGEEEVAPFGMSESERMVAEFLLNKGLTEVQAAAVMGNMRAESGGEVGGEFNFSMIEEGTGAGHGICQWTGTRFVELQAYASGLGKDWTDPQTQLDFFWFEYTYWSGSATYTVSASSDDPPGGTVVTGSAEVFRTTDDVATATEHFCYGWERPGIPRISNRIEFAQRYYASLTLNGTYETVLAAAYFVAETYATPYVFGGNDIQYGCDCSYFVQWCYAQAGISLPRTSDDMRAAGTVVPLDEAIAGDVIWKDGHVGIYVDENTVVEQTPDASGTGWCRVNPMSFNAPWTCCLRFEAPDLEVEDEG